MKYTRQSPSKRYLDLLELYSKMHNEKREDKRELFSGYSVLNCAFIIRELIKIHNAKTLLDYGSGKGFQYKNINLIDSHGNKFDSLKKYLDIENITCYDPAYIEFNQLPNSKFDGVISTDVLEHCPVEDIEWILNEIFSYSNKFVFCNVACYPAVKNLPNGENAHCTIEGYEWWKETIEKISQQYEGINYLFYLSEAPNSKEKTITNIENLPSNFTDLKVIFPFYKRVLSFINRKLSGLFK